MSITAAITTVTAAESSPTGRATQILRGKTLQGLRSTALGFRPSAVQPTQVRLSSLGLRLGNGNAEPQPACSSGLWGAWLFEPGRTVKFHKRSPDGKEMGLAGGRISLCQRQQPSLIVPLLCNCGQATYPLCASVSPIMRIETASTSPGGCRTPAAWGDVCASPQGSVAWDDSPSGPEQSPPWPPKTHPLPVAAGLWVATRGPTRAETAVTGNFP